MQSARPIVITVSDRCADGRAQDRSGPRIVELLEAAGFTGAEVRVVPDGIEPVQAALRAAVADGARVVVTTGGTGISPRDLTPEATTPLLDRALPGIPAAIRAAGQVPTAVLSRAVAGTIGGTFVVNAPGSVGGVEDTMAVVLPLLPHVLSQLDGGDHD